MNYGFLLCGIMFVMIAMILFIIDSRKNELKTENLERINTDVEQLLEELNTMSTLIVDEMDKRHSKMLNVYSEFENLLTVASRENQQTGAIIEPESNNKREGVLELRKKGLTPSQIARSMGMGTGEVELILRLANRGVKDNVEII